ncbi:MAG: hypothetical protein AB1439_09135 [candidate division FCPU426 bacterium]
MIGSAGVIIRRAVPLACLLVFGLNLAWAAQGPQADVAPFIKKRETRPAGEVKARYADDPLKLPEAPWNVPGVPLVCEGRGLSLYYLIPVSRVEKILPPGLKPFPGPKDIWFRVDALQWTAVHSAGRPPVTYKPFVELGYRFEVTENGKRGTYPLRLYFEPSWPILWARQHGAYAAYPLSGADVNFSPFIHFFQLRRGNFAALVAQVDPRQGVGAQAMDLFSRGQDGKLWQGDGMEFVWPRDTQRLTPVSRKLTAEIKPAQTRMLLVKEPVEWNILTEDEALQPAKVLLLESVQGDWLTPAGAAAP